MTCELVCKLAEFRSNSRNKFQIKNMSLVVQFYKIFVQIIQWSTQISFFPIYLFWTNILMKRKEGTDYESTI